VIRENSFLGWCSAAFSVAWQQMSRWKVCSMVNQSHWMTSVQTEKTVEEFLDSQQGIQMLTAHLQYHHNGINNYRCANLTAQITVRKLYYLTTVTVMSNLTMILLWTSIQVLWSVMRIHENIFLGELNVPYKSSERQLTNYWIRAPPLVGGDDAGQERWRVSRNAVEDDRWLWNVWKYQLTGVKRMMWVRLT